MLQVAASGKTASLGRWTQGRKEQYLSHAHRMGRRLDAVLLYPLAGVAGAAPVGALFVAPAPGRQHGPCSKMEGYRGRE